MESYKLNPDNAVKISGMELMLIDIIGKLEGGSA